MRALVKRSTMGHYQNKIISLFTSCRTRQNTYLSLAETLDGETTSGVRQVNLLTDLDIILERDILNLNIVIRPLVEKLTGAIGSSQNVGGQIQSNHAVLIKMYNNVK
jgi:hypothetical protein